MYLFLHWSLILAWRQCWHETGDSNAGILLLSVDQWRRLSEMFGCATTESPTHYLKWCRNDAKTLLLTVKKRIQYCWGPFQLTFEHLNHLRSIEMAEKRFVCFICSKINKKWSKLGLKHCGWLYRKTSPIMTWYITGLPSGISLRPYRWTFAECDMKLKCNFDYFLMFPTIVRNSLEAHHDILNAES